MNIMILFRVITVNSVINKAIYDFLVYILLVGYLTLLHSLFRNEFFFVAVYQFLT